jgi:hypothetical protein
MGSPGRNLGAHEHDVHARPAAILCANCQTRALLRTDNSPAVRRGDAAGARNPSSALLHGLHVANVDCDVLDMYWGPGRMIPGTMRLIAWRAGFGSPGAGLALPLDAARLTGSLEPRRAESPRPAPSQPGWVYFMITHSVQRRGKRVDLLLLQHNQASDAAIGQTHPSSPGPSPLYSDGDDR